MKISEMPLKKLRNILLQITPEITAILDDFTSIEGMRKKPDDISVEEAAKLGVKIIKEYINLFLTRQYESIVMVLAALYSVSIDEIEDKSLNEIIEMIEETLQDKLLLRFFPSLGRLSRKIPSDI